MGEVQSGEEQGLWRQAAWVHIPALPLVSCVTSGQALNPSVLCFLHLFSGDNTYPKDCEEYELFLRNLLAQ